MGWVFLIGKKLYKAEHSAQLMKNKKLQLDEIACVLNHSQQTCKTTPRKYIEFRRTNFHCSGVESSDEEEMLLLALVRLMPFLLNMGNFASRICIIPS